MYVCVKGLQLILNMLPSSTSVSYVLFLAAQEHVWCLLWSLNVCICSHVNLTGMTCDILDQTSQHLTCAIALHKGIQLSNCCGKSSSFYLIVDSKKINDPLEFLDFSFLGSDMKITIARCDDLSLLFLNAASGIAISRG